MTAPTGRPRGRPSKTTPADDDDDDLIGGGEAPAPKKAPAKRQPKSTKPAKEPPKDADGEIMSFDVADVYGGVSAAWLAQVFNADKNTIKKKLARGGCEPVGRGRGNAPLYAIHEAAAYLVKPKIDLITYIKSLRPNDLPPMLNEAYWSAMLKRQKWEENAKDLWRTEDVARILGDVAFLYKTTSQLWVEELDRHHGLTAEMRETLIQLVDTLLERIHEELTSLSQRQSTASSVAEEGAMPSDGNENKPQIVDGETADGG